VRLEARTRSIGVALEDEAFGLRRIETLVIPAGVGTAASIAGVVAVDVAGEVGEGEVPQLHAGVIRSFGCAGVALVDVCLSDEDWEGDVVDAHVTPCNVLDKPLSADPGLQACSVQTASDGNTIEVNIRYIGEFALALSERADGKTMCLIANRTIRHVQVVRSVVDRDRVVAIESDQVCDPDIASTNIESIRVEREALPLVRNGVNDTVRDVDIASFDLDVPSNGFAGLQTLDTATLYVEHHKMWATGNAGSI